MSDEYIGETKRDETEFSGAGYPHMKKWLLPLHAHHGEFSPANFLNDALFDVMMATIGTESFDKYLEHLNSDGLELFRNAIVEEDTDERVEIPPR